VASLTIITSASKVRADEPAKKNHIKTTKKHLDAASTGAPVVA